MIRLENIDRREHIGEFRFSADGVTATTGYGFLFNRFRKIELIELGVRCTAFTTSFALELRERTGAQETIALNNAGATGWTVRRSLSATATGFFNDYDDGDSLWTYNANKDTNSGIKILQFRPLVSSATGDVWGRLRVYGHRI